MTETETIADEVFQERAAICEYDGLLTREQAEAQGLLESESYRAACEARDVVMRFYPVVSRLEAYFAKVILNRGKEAADKLRADCRIAWKERSKNG